MNGHNRSLKLRPAVAAHWVCRACCPSLVLPGAWSPSGSGFIVRSGRKPASSCGPCRDWFIRTLRLLKDIRSHWERAQPLAVCGFATDRGAAETALSGHRTGTFLVRWAVLCLHYRRSATLAMSLFHC